VPVSVADALRRALDEQVKVVRRDQRAAVLAMLDAAVADDGNLDTERLSQAEQEAEKLGRFDEAEAKRFASLAIAIREIADVVGDADHASSSLDAAVGRLDRTADDLPPRCADVLGRGLARRLVDRGMRRLRDSELLDPGSPTAGKVRAIEDSCQDLSESLRIDPRSWAALSELGFCKSLRGDYDQAIDRYGEALALLDKAGGDAGIRDEILRRRAYSRVKIGRYSEAADDYLACMKGNKILGTTLLQLADDGVRAGAFAEAAAVLDRTRRLLDEDPAIFGGNPPAMAEVLESLVWLMVCGYGDDPAGRSVPLARKQLALADAAVAASAGDDKQAATATVARGNALDNLALACARAGDWDEAIRTIDEAIAHVEQMPRMQAEFRKHREAIAGEKTWNEPN
jgi:tetratricopeptide (TPR) repeat protein